MTPQGKAGEKRIRIGGLMRCCLKTIEEAETKNVEGETLACRWCSGDGMVYRNGAWEWAGAQALFAR